MLQIFHLLLNHLPLLITLKYNQCLLIYPLGSYLLSLPSSSYLLPISFSVEPSVSDAERSDSDPVIPEAAKKKLKTKAQRDQLIPQPLYLSSSDNFQQEPSSRRRRHRRNRDKAAEANRDKAEANRDKAETKMVNEPKPKAKRSKTPSNQTEYKMSSEAFAFWGTAAASAESQSINKAKSLVTDRDSKKSALSVKNKESSPAKLAYAKSADSKQKTAKSSDSRQKSSEKTIRSKSKSKEGSPKRHSSPHRKQSSKKDQDRQKSGDRAQVRSQSRKRSGKLSKSRTRSPDHEVHHDEKEAEHDVVKPRKRRSKRSHTARNDELPKVKEKPRSPSIKNQKSRERTFDSISTLPSDFVATNDQKLIKNRSKPSKENVAPVKDKPENKEKTIQQCAKAAQNVDDASDSQSIHVSELRSLYEDGKAKKEVVHTKHFDDHVQWSDTITLEQNDPSPVVEPTTQNIMRVEPAKQVELEVRTSATQCNIPQVSDSGVQCDKSEKESSAMEQKLSSIEQAVTSIQTAVSQLTSLVDSISKSEKLPPTTQITPSKSAGSALPSITSLKTLSGKLQTLSQKTVDAESSIHSKLAMSNDILSQLATVEHQDNLCEEKEQVNDEESDVTQDDPLSGYVQETPIYMTSSFPAQSSFTDYRDSQEEYYGQDIDRSVGDEEIIEPELDPKYMSDGDRGFPMRDNYIINLDALLATLPQEFGQGLVLEMEDDSESTSVDDNSTGVVITELTDSQAAAFQSGADIAELGTKVSSTGSEQQFQTEEPVDPVDTESQLQTQQWDEPISQILTQQRDDPVSQFQTQQWDEPIPQILTQQWVEPGSQFRTDEPAAPLSKFQLDEPVEPACQPPVEDVVQLNAMEDLLVTTKSKKWIPHKWGYSKLDNESDEETLLPSETGQHPTQCDMDTQLSHSTSTVTNTTIQRVKSTEPVENAGPPTGFQSHDNENLDLTDDITSQGQPLTQYQSENHAVTENSICEDSQTTAYNADVQMNDDVSVITELSTQSSPSLAHTIQLPLQPGKKKQTLKSRLARAFGLSKKEKHHEQPPPPTDESNKDSISENIDDLFATLPPPTDIKKKGKKENEKRSTWRRRSSKHNEQPSVKSSCDESSASSVPKTTPPPPPQQHSKSSLKRMIYAGNNSSKTSQKTITPSGSVPEQLESLLEEH